MPPLEPSKSRQLTSQQIRDMGAEGRALGRSQKTTFRSASATLLVRLGLLSRPSETNSGLKVTTGKIKQNSHKRSKPMLQQSRIRGS